MKYELIAEKSIEFMGRKLFQIRALISFGTVTAGDKGGYVESENNLAQVSGNAWVSGNARVYGNARVSGNAQVSGNAWVYGNARVSGNAQVSGNAWVSGNARVYGNARVSPLNLIGTRYNITITDLHIQIGCKFHTHQEWESFTDKQISAMDNDALVWWNEWKGIVLSLALGHRIKINGGTK